MDKRYFEESYIFIEWKGEMQMLYWKMSDGIYNFFHENLLK